MKAKRNHHREEMSCNLLAFTYKPKMDSVWCPHQGRALHTPQPMCHTLTVPLSLSSWGPGWEQFSMTLGSERLGEDESCECNIS